MGKNCSYSLKRKADSANPSSFSTRLVLGRASLIAQLVKNLPAKQDTLVQFLGWEDPWKVDRLPTPVFLGLHCGSAGKESTFNVRDLVSIPGLVKYPGERKG